MNSIDCVKHASKLSNLHYKTVICGKTSTKPVKHVLKQFVVQRFILKM